MKMLEKLKRRLASTPCTSLTGRRKKMSSTTNNNNLPPIQFHSVHGNNVKLSNDGTAARRTHSYCDGIVFSNRPVKEKERVIVRLAEVTSSWSGSIRFGFTNIDPSAQSRCLPSLVDPDMTKRPGTWAKALSERFTAPDTVVSYYYSESTVYYSVNGVEKKPFKGVEGHQVWAIIDIYGRTSCIQLIDPRMHHNNNAHSKVTVHHQSTSHLNLDYKEVTHEMRDPSPQIYRKCNLSPLKFHSTKGCNVRLSTDRNVAERSSNHFSQGYVFSSRPLNLNEKVVIQVLQTDALFFGSMSFALTTCNPDTICAYDLPEDANNLLDRPEYWVVSKEVANNPAPGDEISFEITPSGKVVMVKNRQKPVTLMHVDPSQSFYFCFDLYGSSKKVKLLGTLTSIPVAITHPFSTSTYNRRLQDIYSVYSISSMSSIYGTEKSSPV